MQKQLFAQNLAKAYNGRKVVKNVSLEVSSGEIVGLLGPNGAGKTTCFYMILGLVKSDEGRILLDQQDLTPAAHSPASTRRHWLSATRSLYFSTLIRAG